jgi:hypothetical protein
LIIYCISLSEPLPVVPMYALVFPVPPLFFTYFFQLSAVIDALFDVSICHDLAFHEPFSTFHGRFIPNANRVIP